MAKRQHTTAGEVKIKRENQEEIALAILQGDLREIRKAIRFWKARLAAKQAGAAKAVRG